MYLEKISQNPFINQLEGKTPDYLPQLIRKYLYRWPLYLIGIGLCIALAFTYIKFADPAYIVSAKVLIKDETKGLSTVSALQKFDLFQTKSAVENEMEILKSRTLVKQVIHKLNLWARYEEIGKIKDKELYADLPVKFLLRSQPEKLTGQTIEIIIKDGDSFILKQADKQQLHSFNTNFKNDFGIWKLVPNSNISNYAGKVIRITLNNPDEVTDAYIEKLNVALPNKKSTIVDLSLKENSRARGKDILNNLITIYNHAAIDDKNRVSQSTLKFIDERLLSLTGELNKAEKDVENFKSKIGLTDISSKSKLFLENVKDNDTKLNEAKVQLQVLDGIESYINSAKKSGTAPATTGISDPALIVLINQLINLELQRDRLLAITPENNPVFDGINRQIGSTKASIKENVSGIKASLLTIENQLQNYNSSFEASIRKLPGQEREFVSIKRQQGIKEELYVYLLQKREEAAVNYASTVVDSRTVDQAYAGKPVAPNKPLVFVIAIFLGLVLPTGLIYARHAFNNRINFRRDIEESAHLTVLTELSFENAAAPLVNYDKGTYILGEQFRALRTNLHFLHGKKDRGRVTLVTSSVSGEGKSFVTSNLGLALATSGRKTVLIELDLRKPGISKNFNLQQQFQGHQTI